MWRRIEAAAFEYSLRSPYFFRYFLRPEIYRRYGPDPEDVHDSVVENLPAFYSTLKKHCARHEFTSLSTTIKGRKILPFGAAAGFDKDGKILKELSQVFGFLEPGTLTLKERKGNSRPRIHARGEDIYNAQGFPSRGLEYFLNNIAEYRKQGFDKPIYVSVCGLPGSSSNNAYYELEEMVDALNPCADGFVWNPFSPSMDSVRALRTEEAFKRTARLIRKLSGGSLLLVKMGPYEESEEAWWMGLVNAWLSGGGDGVVAVNSKPVSKETVPAGDWVHFSAGRSGRFLRTYRMRSVGMTRRNFPDAIIFAAGGIYDGDDAYETFLAGADALEGYTPYTYYGLGLAGKIMKGVAKNMRRHGYEGLDQLRDDCRKNLNETQKVRVWTSTPKRTTGKLEK